jgi:hypothetical protein
VLASVGGESQWIASDHSQDFSAVEQVFEHLVADEAGWRGDDDHGSCLH